MFLALGIAHLITAFTNVYGIILVGLLICGIGIGLVPANVGAWIASTTPSAVRGRVYGGRTSILFLGHFFVPIFTQPLVQQVNINTTFWVLGGVSIFLTIIFVITSLNWRYFSDTKTN